MSMKKNKSWIGWTIGVIIFAGIIWLLVSVQGAQAGPYKEFAQCLDEAGAKFYGAYWCPHCNDQKKMFKGAASSLPYIECAIPGGQGQMQVCVDAGIEGYPTWIFEDGERMSGAIPLEVLAEKTSCALPEEVEVSNLPPEDVDLSEPEEVMDDVVIENEESEDKPKELPETDVDTGDLEVVEDFPPMTTWEEEDTTNN